jgi:hypothetical protein
MNAELMQIESRYWNSMKDRDPAEAGELTDDECIIVGAQGVMSVSPQMVAKMLEDGSWRIDRYTMDESKAQVRMLTDDIAIIAYPVREDVRVDGKKVSLQAFDSTVWVRKDGKWVTVLHTESIAGDPFGRDKKAPTARAATGRNGKPAAKKKPAARTKTASRKTTPRKRTRARAR